MMKKEKNRCFARHTYKREELLHILVWDLERQRKRLNPFNLLGKYGNMRLIIAKKGNWKVVIEIWEKDPNKSIAK